MFFLKKLVSCIILPPGVFILVFIGSGFYLLKQRRRIGYLLIFSGICLYALSIGPVKDALISPLENAFPVQADVSGDVIVILGSGTKAEALSRLTCGHRLWKRLHVPVILTGCGEGTEARGREGTEVRGQRTDVRRARARDGGREGKGKRLLMEMGIPENEIIEERRSKDTSENARYAKQIIEKRGFKSPILVTSAYHIKRAVFLFEKQGMKVEPFSCGLKSEEEEEGYGILDFLPKASVLEESSKALKEYMGLIAARMEIF